MHIHHMFWGILILLAVGFGWVAELGNANTSSSAFMGRFMSLLYGAGAGMTLDVLRARKGEAIRKVH